MVDHDKELKDFLMGIAETGAEEYGEIGDDAAIKLTSLYLKSSYGCDSSAVFEDIDICNNMSDIIVSENWELFIERTREMVDLMAGAAISSCSIYVNKILPGMASDSRHALNENSEIDRGDGLDNALVDIAGVFDRFGHGIA